MREKFGEHPALTPHWDALYEASKQRHGERVEKFFGTSEKTAKVRKIVKDKVARVKKSEMSAEQLKKNMAEDFKAKGDKANLGAFVKRLALKFIEGGTTEREALVDKLHAAVKEINPAITREGVMDLFSDYGKTSPAPEGARKIAAQLRGEVTQVRKLRDMERGDAPKATGPQRVEPSDEYRKLTKDVEETKRKGGFKVTDAATHLKTALGAIQTRLKNELTDLENAIKNRKPLLDRRNKVEYDAETKRLKEARDVKRKEYLEMFPKREATEAEKVAMAIKATDKSIAALEEQIKTGNIHPAVKTKLSSAELDAKRARLESLRDERDALRGIDTERLEKDRIKALEISIAKAKAKIAANDTAMQGKSQNVKTEAVTALEAELKGHREELRQLRAKDEVRQLERWTANESRKLADLLERIATENVTPKVKNERTVRPDAGLIQVQFELMKAKRKFMEMVAEKERANYTPLQKLASYGADTFHTLRAIMTGGDLSAVLRQGKLFVLAHPVMAYHATKDMFRAFKSEVNEHSINQDLFKSKHAHLYEVAKLNINDPNDFTAAQLEGNYRSRWINNNPLLGGRAVPIIAGSGRAYGTFMNVARARTFDYQVDLLERAEGRKITTNEAKALATQINEFTGSGSLGLKSQQATGLMNVFFFAPKYVISRFQVLLGHGLWSEHSNAATRKIALKEYGRALSGMAMMYALYSAARAASGEKEPIELDPRSSLFGKLKFGASVVDPLAGLSQSAVFASKIISGKSKNSKGELEVLRANGEEAPKFGKQDAGTVIGKFLRSKLSPLAGMGVNFATGKDYSGNQVTVASQAKALATPMVVNDMVEAMEAHGCPRGVALSFLTLFGESVNTSKPQQPKPSKTKSTWDML